MVYSLMDITMDNKANRKELIENFKQRKKIGGVYTLKCAQVDGVYLGGTINLSGIKNRFEFSKMTDSCIHSCMSADWKKYGAQSFSIEVLEELEMSDTQTDKEFEEEVELMRNLWIEKLTSQNISYELL